MAVLQPVLCFGWHAYAHTFVGACLLLLMGNNLLSSLAPFPKVTDNVGKHRNLTLGRQCIFESASEAENCVMPLPAGA